MSEEKNLMNEPKEGIGVLGQLRKYQKKLEEIEQILGKALGYPYFKDDPKNFPTATEADGVCVGDHTAWSLAMCAADRIKELEERNKKLSKRHPTEEEARAQFEFIKARSQRSK